MTEDRVEEDKDQQAGANAETPMAERRAAHERLVDRRARALDAEPARRIRGASSSAGSASSPFSFVLVATVGGELRDEFEIPGSDTQKATDLIEAEFASEQGGVLNVVFAAPEGERLDTPERQAAIEEAIARLAVAGVRAHRGQGRPGERRRSVQRGHVLRRRPHRLRRGAVRSRRSRTRIATPVVAVQDAVRETVEPAGVTVEFNGEAEFPPIEQGTSEVLGLLAAIIVLLVVFRTFVAMIIPIALALAALATAFLLLFILAGLTDINTITPILVSMIGLGVGIDYSLFIVTRFRQLLHDGLSPRDAAAEAGASAGRAVIFAGPDGRDLGERPGLLRPRLRDQARHRQRPRRADHGADRELAAARGAGAARPQDRPAEGAVPAPGRRLGGRAARRPSSPAGAAS